MKKYVVGLCFRQDKILLIHKNRGPEYVVGKLNGIGGKIEIGETPVEAMEREFLEETGVKIPKDEWLHSMFMPGRHADTKEEFEIHFFTNMGSNEPFETQDDGSGETLSWHDIKDISESPILVPNLRWIIPLSIFTAQCDNPLLSLPMVIESD